MGYDVRMSGLPDVRQLLRPTAASAAGVIGWWVRGAARVAGSVWPLNATAAANAQDAAQTAATQARDRDNAYREADELVEEQGRGSR